MIYAAEPSSWGPPFARDGSYIVVLVYDSQWEIIILNKACPMDQLVWWIDKMINLFV